MFRFGLTKKTRDLSPLCKEIRRALGSRSLVLVGMPGCGKSAIGRRLANRLDLPFLDADEEIEKAAGKTISEIFTDHGEPHFRDGERKVIARLLLSGPQVLATGGGALQSAETRENIKKAGISIWLKADLPLLMRRVSRRDHRPLLMTVDPEAKMRELIALRHPLYAQADLIVDSRDVAHDIIVDEILDGLSKGPLAAAADVAHQQGAR
jgi:shikimate kinase